MVAATGLIAGPYSALSPIPVPLAELFTVASEHERNGRLEDAGRLLGHILAAEPGQPDALHLAGIVAFRRGRREEALVQMRRSLQLGVNTPLYWRNICEVLRVLGHLDEAVAAGRRAVTLNPDDPVTLANLAVIHAERLELNEAEACEQQALALDPGYAGAHFGLAEVKLLRGEFERGLHEYEWRFRLPGAHINLPPGARMQWDGRALPPGRLLVIADQGFGDVIQFGRFLPAVFARCPDPLFACGKEMISVLQQFGARRLFGSWDSLPEHDCYIPMSGLPRLAGMTLATIPAPVPYLRADPARVAHWSAVVDQLAPTAGRRVGLVWAGRPTHANDHRRSTSLASLSPLFSAQGIAYVSLQKGDRQADIGRYYGAAPLINLGAQITDWEDSMAVIAALDAVVTVDTAVAHFAGAMGRPVHLMLPHAGEWRWLLQREDSPWYPTMRLHRQPSPGRWDAVAHSVAARLQEAFSTVAKFACVAA